MGTPIYNPAIPFSGPIPGGINVGRMIRIQGTPTAVSNRFAINLQCGPNLPPREDIALHMDFRFTRSPPCIARNSLANGQWGHEENSGHLPVARGQPFEVLILIEHSSFKVAINGQHYTEFHHRLPFQRVTYVAIDGEVQVSAITFEGTIGGGAAHMPGAVHVMPMPAAHVQPHVPMVHGVAPVPVVYPVGAVHHGGPHGHPGHHQQHHGYPSHGHGYPSHGHSAAIPIVGGMAVGAAGAMALHGHSPKSAKKQKKAMKKAMKHHKHAHHGMHGYHGHHHGKSSSSSSSSSEEE